ncbi:MAG: hypothetical protein ACOZIN_17645, partial [Myxococcota bacterium]
MAARLHVVVLFLLAAGQARAAGSPTCNGPFLELGGSARGGGVSNRPTSIRCQRIELDRQGKPFAMWADDSVGTWEVYLR